jgi:DNA-directed RNA polymerase specialized sigma24 family protein
MNSNVINESQFQELIDDLESRTDALYGRLNLVPELKGVFSKLLLTSEPGDNHRQFLSDKLPFVVEECFKGLRGFCMGYLLKTTRDPELSEDIAQEAILQLMNSTRQIHKPRPWLIQVCRNLLIAHYRNNNIQNDLLNTLEIESKISTQIDTETDFDPSILTQFPDLFDKNDYQVLLEMVSYSDLKSYASAKGISLEKAKQTSKELKHNFKAAWMRYDGWDATAKILSYQQYKALKRYITQILEIAASKDPENLKKNSFNVDPDNFFKAFKGFKELYEWSYFDNGDTSDLVLVGEPGQTHPVVVTLRISFSDKGRIITHKCYQNQLRAILPKLPELDQSMLHNRCTLSFNQIEDIIKRAEESGKIIWSDTAVKTEDN